MSRSATMSDEMQPLHAWGPVLVRAGRCVLGEKGSGARPCVTCHAEAEAPLWHGYPRLVSEAVIFYLRQGQLWDAQIFRAGCVNDGHCDRARR